MLISQSAKQYNHVVDLVSAVLSDCTLLLLSVSVGCCVVVVGGGGGMGNVHKTREEPASLFLYFF